MKKPLISWNLEITALIKDKADQQLYKAVSSSSAGPAENRCHLLRVLKDTETGRQLWQALSRYSLPHVVQIAGCQSHGDLLLIQERYYEGQTLDGCIRTPGRFSKTDILLAGIQLVKDLQVLYENEGILHLDIKPENLMVDVYNNVTLMDFGAAVHRIDQTNLLHADQYGTPSYTAPERLISPNATGPLSDLHSLAKTLRFWLELQGHLDFELWQTLLWWEEAGLHRLGAGVETWSAQNRYYQSFLDCLVKGLTT